MTTYRPISEAQKDGTVLMGISREEKYPLPIYWQEPEETDDGEGGWIYQAEPLCGFTSEPEFFFYPPERPDFDK